MQSIFCCNNCAQRVTRDDNGVWRHWTDEEFQRVFHYAAHWRPCPSIAPRNLTCPTRNCRIDHPPIVEHQRLLYHVDGSQTFASPPSSEGRTCPYTDETWRLCAVGRHLVLGTLRDAGEGFACEACYADRSQCADCDEWDWRDEMWNYDDRRLCQTCYDEEVAPEEDQCNCDDCREERGEYQEMTPARRTACANCGEIQEHLDELTGEFICSCEATRRIALDGRPIRFKKEVA
jgi:hypothetical protein